MNILTIWLLILNYINIIISYDASIDLPFYSTIYKTKKINYYYMQKKKK